MSDLMITAASGATGAHIHLRFKNHLDAIGKMGKRTALIPGGAEVDEAVKWLCRADIFHSGQGCHYSLAQKYFAFRDDWFAQTGKYIPIVWDVDDNPETISPWNAAYCDFGEEDVELVPEKGEPYFLWKDGVDGFDLAKNRANMAAFRFMIQHADAVTCTTEHLRDTLLPHNKNIHIVPNRINFDYFRIRNKPQDDGLVRILYMGGSSHFRDWKFVAPALKFLTKKYPHIRLVALGNVREWAKADLGEEFVEDRVWAWDYKSFCLRMGTMGVDIGIAPLYLQEDHDERFSLCKSNLKWLDYAAVGIPCVAQDCVVYDDILFSEDMPDIAWDGMKATTHDQWVIALSALIENPEMRNLMGNNAYNRAQKEFNAAHCGPITYSMYEQIHAEATWKGKTPMIDVREEVKCGG